MENLLMLLKSGLGESRVIAERAATTKNSQKKVSLSGCLLVNLNVRGRQ